MLAGSWALTRTPWLTLRLSAHATRVRTYVSPYAGAFHANRLRHTHCLTERSVDVSLPDVAAKEASDPPADVFEEYAEEYSAVVFTSKRLSPSMMEVIDSTLPAKLLQPSTDDLSIFEDESSEYGATTLASSASNDSLDVTLLKLLAKEKYDEVYTVLLEAKQLGHRIQEHSNYEAAAVAALKTEASSRTLSSQMERFETFFSLIPSSRVANRVRTFKGIRERILNTPLIDLDLIIRFSLVLIGKGYMNLVQKYTIPIITRFASSEVCFQFVDDGIIANKRYWLSQLPPDKQNAKIKSWNLRSTTIYWLTFSGRIDEVVALLPRNGSPVDDFRLSRETHALLRFRLKHSSNPEHHELIDYVDSLLRYPTPINQNGPGPSSGSLISREAVPKTSSTLGPDFSKWPEHSAFVELENSDKIIEMDHPLSLPNTLAVSLRQLKNSYMSSASPVNLFTTPPPLEEVLSFFESYLAVSLDKNGRAIDLLRRRVFKLGPGPASHFLFAEMLHYFRTGIPNLVIETFVDHFYISAVPREDILVHYYEFRNRRMAGYNVSMDTDATDLPFRIGLSRRGSLPSIIRLWPATGHTALVWNALVKLARDDSTVLQLYQKLLQIASEGYSSFSVASQFEQSYSSALVPPSTWSANVPAAAFTPFLRRMLQSSSPNTAASLGTSLLGDMVRAGIEPNIYHLTEIAQFYAQQGDSRRALMIMEKMEEAEKGREKPIDSLTDNGLGSSVKSATFPVPDIVFYCALLRVLIYTRNLGDAEKVAARIEERYQLGSASEDLSSSQLEVIGRLREGLVELREIKRS